MTLIANRADVFSRRAARARELASAQPFAGEPLNFYAAIADAQQVVFERAAMDRPARADAAAYVAREALPAIIDATMQAGTEQLKLAVILRFHDGDFADVVETWLRGGEQDTTDAFVARACAAPVLEALPELAESVRIREGDGRHCPRCGGLPQLAVFADTGEALVTGQRRLVCSRCAHEWSYARMTCASCGDSGGARQVILSDPERLPHVRIDACDACACYLLTVDVHKEPRAVPIADEIAALPLDLAAADRGYTKIARNLMGF
jgi:formate dehydrogenase maturation protein FdhE